MNDIQKTIARNIILAQVASDGGKYIEDIMDIIPGAKYTWYQGYSLKDIHIEKAMKMIAANSGKTGYYYTVTRDKNINSYLIYFSFKLEGKRYQVSFHSFNNWQKYLSKTQPTYWDHKSSRQAVISLADYYFSKDAK